MNNNLWQSIRKIQRIQFKTRINTIDAKWYETSLILIQISIKQRTKMQCSNIHVLLNSIYYMIPFIACSFALVTFSCKLIQTNKSIICKCKLFTKKLKSFNCVFFPSTLIYKQFESEIISINIQISTLIHGSEKYFCFFGSTVEKE